MEKVSRWSSLLVSASRLLPITFCLLLAYCLQPTVLNAQGCAMCYTSASAAQSGAKNALANGTLILFVPPMVFFALITVVLYMYRNKFRETSVARGPWSVDPVVGRASERSAEASGLGFWSPGRSDAHPLPRATDN